MMITPPDDIARARLRSGANSIFSSPRGTRGWRSCSCSRRPTGASSTSHGSTRNGRGSGGGPRSRLAPPLPYDISLNQARIVHGRYLNPNGISASSIRDQPTVMGDAGTRHAVVTCSAMVCVALRCGAVGDRNCFRQPSHSTQLSCVSECRGGRRGTKNFPRKGRLLSSRCVLSPSWVRKRLRFCSSPPRKLA